MYSAGHMGADLEGEGCGGDVRSEESEEEGEKPVLLEVDEFTKKDRWDCETVLGCIATTPYNS